jgi:hypothetical protein
MLSRTLGILGLTTALMGLGCGGLMGSCSEVISGVTVSCLEYEQYPLGKETLRSACGAWGQFSDGPCTSQNRTGRCRVTTEISSFNVSVSTRIVHSYYLPVTTEGAEATCQSLDSDAFTQTTFLGK